MSNEHDSALGGPDERRPARNRDRDVNPWTTSEARMVWLKLGVDIHSQDSIDDFNETLEWARARRKREQRWNDIRRQIVVGGIVAFVGGVVAAAFQWLSTHANIGRPS